MANYPSRRSDPSESYSNRVAYFDEKSKKSGNKRRRKKSPGQSIVVDEATGHSLVIARNLRTDNINMVPPSTGGAKISKPRRRNKRNTARSSQKKIVTPRRNRKTKKLPSLDDPFANRIQELQILKTHNYLFYMIHAPAGYGKTHLLRNLHESMGSEGNLETVWFDFDFKAKSDKNAKTDPKILLSELLAYLGEERYENEPEPARLNHLARALTRSGKSIVFFFDSIELADETVFQWIANFLLAKLNGRPRVKGLRAFFASRYNRPLPGGGEATQAGIALQPFRLSNFSHKDLGVVIRTIASAKGYVLEDSETLDLAKAILDLTRGHPRCVTAILNRLLHESGFTNPRANGRFDAETRSRFFENCVMPIVIDQILSDVGQFITLEQLQIIFSFRIIYTTIITVLVKDELEERGMELPNIGEGFIRSVLLPTNLIHFSEEEDWVIDPIVRHYFAEKSKLESKIQNDKLYLSLHAKAREWFLKSFKGIDVFDAVRGKEQNRHFVEVLYHWCREVEFRDPSLEDKIAEFYGLVDVWKSYSRPQHSDHRAHAANLGSLLERDDEIDLPIMIGSLINDTALEVFKSRILAAGHSLDQSPREQ